ncbi:hypothetical protein BDK51DRAFT_46531 [Blyttiomyces helicus]|uniref:Uncharacterized protein n=1 Tax=Blyttiomyces helicus TaxID=388810 RepID=A0A4P9W6A1_9FUNG|nr:hypothetical protein BDK51DRAFT_46531 [Blyttiomyces helicus]|eukprot:RKO86885.1 hypothetical protein BDK51DRAFT_46531 [Blyttiomyces helicus]
MLIVLDGAFEEQEWKGPAARLSTFYLAFPIVKGEQCGAHGARSREGDVASCCCKGWIRNEGTPVWEKNKNDTRFDMCDDGGCGSHPHHHTSGWKLEVSARTVDGRTMIREVSKSPSKGSDHPPPLGLRKLPSSQFPPSFSVRMQNCSKASPPTSSWLKIKNVLLSALKFRNSQVGSLKPICLAQTMTFTTFLMRRVASPKAFHRNSRSLGAISFDLERGGSSKVGDPAKYCD